MNLQNADIQLTVQQICKRWLAEYGSDVKKNLLKTAQLFHFNYR